MEDDSFWVPFLIDLCVGSIAGGAGTLFGQPLDTVKVRMQTKPKEYPGMLSTIRKTVAEEGVRGLYKGLAMPLLGNMPYNAILFASNRTALRAMGNDPANPVEAPISHQVMASYISGTAATFVIVPTELVKCQQQVMTDAPQQNKKGAPKVDTSNWGILKHVSKVEGFPQGPYRGFLATQLRDPPSFIFYFGIYEHLKHHFEQANWGNDALRSMLAGGTAGMLSWVVVYPFDLVKSKIQAAPVGAPKEQRSFRPVLRDFVGKYGFSALFRGLTACAVRAFFANAVIFSTYDYQYRLLEDYGILT